MGRKRLWRTPEAVVILRINCHGCNEIFLPLPKNRTFCDNCKGNAKRAARNARGLCARCGERELEPNRTQCTECAKYGARVVRKLCRERKATGLCTGCGVHPLAGPWLCVACDLEKTKRRLRTMHSFDDADMLRYFTQTTCDWCGLPFDDVKRPHVDHDHRCCASKRGGAEHCWHCTRGFLHYDCNQRILVAHEFIEKECGFVSPQLTAYRRRFPIPRVRL